MTVERVERESAILSRLADDGTVSVSMMATDLGVSEVTIRGDLRALEQEGLLVRMRGGARTTTAKHILQRQRVNVEAKERIAAAAAELVVATARTGPRTGGAGGVRTTGAPPAPRRPAVR